MGSRETDGRLRRLRFQISKGGRYMGKNRLPRTVVALLALSAVARHMAIPSAGVAGLSPTGSAASAIASAITSSTTPIAAAAAVSTALRAVAGDVAYLATFVALLTSTSTSTAAIASAHATASAAAT